MTLVEFNAFAMYAEAESESDGESSLMPYDLMTERERREATRG